MKAAGYDGYTKPSQVPASSGKSADIEVEFADLGLFGPVDVLDIWSGQHAGRFEDKYVARAVPEHGTAFVRLSKAQ